MDDVRTYDMSFAAVQRHVAVLERAQTPTKRRDPPLESDSQLGDLPVCDRELLLHYQWIG